MSKERRRHRNGKQRGGERGQQDHRLTRRTVCISSRKVANNTPHFHHTSEAVPSVLTQTS